MSPFDLSGARPARHDLLSALYLSSFMRARLTHRIRGRQLPATFTACASKPVRRLKPAPQDTSRQRPANVRENLQTFIYTSTRSAAYFRASSGCRTSDSGRLRQARIGSAARSDHARRFDLRRRCRACWVHAIGGNSGTHGREAGFRSRLENMPMNAEQRPRARNTGRNVTGIMQK